MFNATRVHVLCVILAALLIALVTCSAPQPTATHVPATSTSAPPTNTPVPPTDTPIPPTDIPVSPTDAPTPLPPTDTPTPEPPTPTAESAETTPQPVARINVAFILDASGSMLGALDGTTRLAVAQDAVTELSAGLPPEMNASLWVYGHRTEQENKAASCKDIEEVISLGPVDAALFDTVAHSFGAKGFTPIALAIQRAAESLPVGGNEHNSIVLVSDGEETCGGNPCAEAEALKARGIMVTIHAIGFAANADTRAQLQCISEVTGGTYRDAADAEELGLALEGAVADVLTKGQEWTGSLRMNCHAFPVEGKVFCEGWPVGAEVTLQIDDPDTGPGMDYYDSGSVTVSPWGPESTGIEFDLKGVYDLQPGHLITCSGAGFTKEHTVTGLAILAVDPESDIVRGVATPGSELHLTTNPPDCDVWLVLTVGLDGNWEADFGGLFDIDSGTTVEAEEWDDDGDTTHFLWP